MPRRLTALILATVLGVAGNGMAAAQSDGSQRTSPDHLGIDVKAKQGDPSVAYDISAEDEASSDLSPVAGGRRTNSARRNVVYASFPTLETGPDGRCIRNRWRAYPDAIAAAAAVDAQNALWRLAAAGFPLCQRTPVPETTPAAQAAEYWRVVGEDLLPRPTPRIAPGFMLAGKLAYLEAGTVPTARFEHPTPAGVLTIDARAEHYVDWGDDSELDGPFGDAGGPWPDGTITHYWTDVGHYDVRVIQRWVGRWSLGADSGELAGLETVGVIDDFPVEELQAVINRG